MNTPPPVLSQSVPLDMVPGSPESATPETHLTVGIDREEMRKHAARSIAVAAVRQARTAGIVAAGISVYATLLWVVGSSLAYGERHPLLITIMIFLVVFGVLAFLIGLTAYSKYVAQVTGRRR